MLIEIIVVVLVKLDVFGVYGCVVVVGTKSKTVLNGVVGIDYCAVFGVFIFVQVGQVAVCVVY